MSISEFAISKIGCGYVYGATGWICTEKRLQEQAAQYPEQAENILKVSSKWLGKPCYDCAQLVRAAAKSVGLNLPSGATSQWKADIFSEKGKLPLCDGTWAKANLDEGTIIFRQDRNDSSKMAHVGIYIGNGQVVEAKGSSYGVVKTEFAKGNWTHYGVLKVQSAEVRDNGGDFVKGVVTAATGKTVNLRAKAAKNGDVLCKVPVGAEVDAGEIQNGFTAVKYNGTSGWMMTEYVKKAEGESAVFVIEDSAGNIFQPVGDFTVKRSWG